MKKNQKSGWNYLYPQCLTSAGTTVSRKSLTWSEGNKDGNKIKVKLE